MQGIFIALGSNVGNRQETLQHARLGLSDVGELLSASTIIETAALLPQNAPREWNLPYLNQVLQITTTADVHVLFGALKKLEYKIGGAHQAHWAPRTIDIDLLAFDDHICTTPELTLPHARMHERLFVIQPLAEIAPQWVHPVLKKTASELHAMLQAML